MVNLHFEQLIYFLLIGILLGGVIAFAVLRLVFRQTRNAKTAQLVAWPLFVVWVIVVGGAIAWGLI